MKTRSVCLLAISLKVGLRQAGTGIEKEPVSWPELRLAGLPGRPSARVMDGEIERTAPPAAY